MSHPAVSLALSDFLLHLKHGDETLATLPVNAPPAAIRAIAQMAHEGAPLAQEAAQVPHEGAQTAQAGPQTAHPQTSHEGSGSTPLPTRRGLFIVLEGGDGAGKDTQARTLWQRLGREHVPSLFAEEPGGTLLGKLLRGWLTMPRQEQDIPSYLQRILSDPAIQDSELPQLVLRSLTPRAELLLFVLARAQLVEEVLRPALAQGKVVVCSRFAPSTVAYQGYGQGLDIALVHEANRVATGGLEPDLAVLLDVPPEQGLARKRRRRAGAPDHFEDRELAFHRRVRQGYLEMAAADPARWLVLDATQPRERTHEAIWSRMTRLLGDGG